MDPFSVSIGCITLLSVVTKVSRSVTDFAVGFRDARKDLLSVSHELSGLDLTLQVLKADTETKERHELPNVLRQYICDIIENCKNDLTRFEESLRVYEGESLNRTAKWAISGRKDAEKILEAIAAHKGALSLATETITL